MLETQERGFDVLNQRIIFDFQSFLENNTWNLPLKFFCSLFRVWKKFPSKNIVVVFHSNNIEKKIHKILKKSNFSIAYVEDYASFSNFLTQDSIIVSNDKIFLPYLKKYPNSKICKVIADQLAVIQNKNLRTLYGAYEYEDYFLFSLLQESKRLNLSRIKGKLQHCKDFNLGIYRDCISHRFFQRPIRYERENLYQLSNKGEDFVTQDINYEMFDYMLNKYIPDVVPFWDRIYARLIRN